MSRRIGATPFNELLAGSISGDPTIKAAADALDSVLGKATRGITDVLLYGRLAKDSGFVEPVLMLPPMERLTALSGGLSPLPSDVLDLLAWQLHVDSYDAAVDLQAKRELVGMSLLLHRKKGTPWTVLRALDAALQLPPARLEQWFEYGGEPYFFRVYLDISGRATSAVELDTAVRLILEHKNVRSWLEWLRTQSTCEVRRWWGASSTGLTCTRVALAFPTMDIRLTRVTHMICVCKTQSKISLMLDLKLPRKVAVVCAGLTHSRYYMRTDQ